MSSTGVSLEGCGLIIAVPTYDGKVPVEWIEQFGQLQKYGQGYRFDHKLCYQSHGALISSNRNIAAAAFLAEPKATHLLFIDSDIVFKAEQIIKMMALMQIEEYDYDVVTLPYPIKKDEPSFHLSLGNGEVERTRHGLIRTYGAGCGFMMIKRSMLERMIEKYPDLRYYNRKQEKWMYGFFTEGFFEPFLKEDGNGKLYCGEDISFCRRVMETGGKIWFDPSETLTHIGTKAYHFSSEILTKGFESIKFKEI